MWEIGTKAAPCQQRQQRRVRETKRGQHVNAGARRQFCVAPGPPVGQGALGVRAWRLARKRGGTHVCGQAELLLRAARLFVWARGRKSGGRGSATAARKKAACGVACMCGATAGHRGVRWCAWLRMYLGKAARRKGWGKAYVCAGARERVYCIRRQSAAARCLKRAACSRGKRAGGGRAAGAGGGEGEVGRPVAGARGAAERARSHAQLEELGVGAAEADRAQALQALPAAVDGDARSAAAGAARDGAQAGHAAARGWAGRVGSHYLDIEAARRAITFHRTGLVCHKLK